jgi:hypothetical protein
MFKLFAQRFSKHSSLSYISNKNDLKRMINSTPFTSINNKNLFKMISIKYFSTNNINDTKDTTSKFDFFESNFKLEEAPDRLPIVIL